jgi:signal transduction histidine kinase
MWQTLLLLRYATLDDAMQYVFVQQELVPRSEAAAAVLKRLEQANHAAFSDTEADFAASRQGAARALLVLLVLGVVFGGAVARHSIRYSQHLERETERQFEEVSRAKQELERLSLRLMEIQEQERTRLARELHDEIVQNLAVLKLEITHAARNAEHSERLARAREIAERTMRTVRNIMLLLRPSMLDDLGLGPALQWQTEDFQRRTGVTCHYAEQGLDDNLPDALKTCVYRVVQEALHNCQKHAAATEVHVRVEREGSMIHAEVRDNGRGFQARTDGRARAGHFGLIGMRERATGLGGVVWIDSAPGKGTRVKLEVPLTGTSDIARTPLMETHA